MFQSISRSVSLRYTSMYSVTGTALYWSGLLSAANRRPRPVAHPAPEGFSQMMSSMNVNPSSVKSRCMSNGTAIRREASLRLARRTSTGATFITKNRPSASTR